MELVKEFKNDLWNIYWNGRTLEFSNGQAWTVRDGWTFWIETSHNANIPNYAYLAMIALGRRHLGCRYLYDEVTQ